MMSQRLPDPIRQPEFYASVPAKRLIAWIADVLAIFLITLALGVVTFTLAWFLFPLFYLATAFFYRWLSLAYGSATPGMRLMAIEIRDGAGQRLDQQTALLHTLGHLVSMAFALPMLISALMMALGPKGQGLHDLVLGTTAINRPG